MTPPDGTVQDVSPRSLADWLARDAVLLIDVRQPFEFAEERLADAERIAPERLDPAALARRADDRRVVFYCRTGRRSARAAEAYRSATGQAEAFHLAGGIEAWKAEQRDVIRSSNAPRIPVMRQVQLGAGSLVVLGTALGAFVSPWLLILPAFVGAGLVFAGASGWCGLAVLLSKMPWNRCANGCAVGGAGT